MTSLDVLFFKPNTAYEMRISDGSSDVCSSDLKAGNRILYSIRANLHLSGVLVRDFLLDPSHLRTQSYRSQLLLLRDSMNGQLDQMDEITNAEIGRASCRERVCQYVVISVVAVS